MTEPQTVALYTAAFDQSPGASHRLLRQAALRYAPALADLTLASGAHGKPYFPHAPQVQFSISHSGSCWVCAFSGRPVGIDVQQHRACRMQAIASRFFFPEELAYLDRTAYAPFFDLWCAKESLLKLTGQGLGGLTRVCTVSPGGEFPSVEGASLQLLPFRAGYSLCVCTWEPARIDLRTL